MRSRAVLRVLGVAAIGLIIIAAFLTLEVPNTSPTSKTLPTSNTSSANKPIAISTNVVTFFPSEGPLGSFSFALWTLTVHNTSNRTQSLVASLLSNGYPADFQDITLNSSGWSSQNSCEGPFLTQNRNLTMSV